MHATMIDANTGHEHTFSGENLEEIAAQACAESEAGAALSRGEVRKGNGELIGWVHGDGEYRYA